MYWFGDGLTFFSAKFVHSKIKLHIYYKNLKIWMFYLKLAIAIKKKTYKEM